MTLTNSTLQWDSTSKAQIFQDSDGNGIVIEVPTGWRYVFDPINDSDPSRIAHCLHKPKGFEIGGGSRKLRAGLEQTTKLKAGQRYLAKAVYRTEIYTEPGKTYDPFSVHVFFKLNGQEGALSRMMPALNHTEQTTLFVFETDRSGEVDASFWFHSKYALFEVKITILSLELIEVGKDYGTPPIAIIQARAGSEPEPDQPGVLVPAAKYERLMEMVSLLEQKESILREIERLYDNITQIDERLKIALRG